LTKGKGHQDCTKKVSKRTIKDRPVEVEKKKKKDKYNFGSFNPISKRKSKGSKNPH
jgi:hypothetical protein